MLNSYFQDIDNQSTTFYVPDNTDSILNIFSPQIFRIEFDNGNELWPSGTWQN